MSASVDHDDQHVEGEEQHRAEAGHRPQAAAAVHRRRHPRHGRLRPHRQGRQRGRGSGLGAVHRRLRDRAGHRLQLPRAGHQVPPGGGCRAVHAQGVRHPLRHLPRRLHGHVLGHHLGLDGVAGLRLQPRRRVRPRQREQHPGARHRAGLHAARRGGQLPRGRRERQGQRRAHPGRALRPAARHPGRRLRRHRGQGRLLAGDGVRHLRREERLPRRSPRPRRSPSSRWSASRMP